jgi:2-oxoglutarate ferredoxin oxidoreductase subunit alpha
MPKPIVHTMEGAKVGIIAFGSTDPAIREARDKLAIDGLKTDYMRVRAIPFVDEVRQFIEDHDRVYVIEMNRDGQMHQLLNLENCDMCQKLIALPKHDGLPLSARWVKGAIQAEEQK